MLRAAFVSRAHERLGFASFAEYVERLFGYSARTTGEKLRVAEALEQLPELTAALRRGDLTWSAVRELTRIVVHSTEEEWMVAAEGKTCREIEALVAGLAVGASPSDPKDPSIVRHVLRFEVSAETLALFREALAQLRRQTDEKLEDDAALLLVARAVLCGPQDSGRSSYQVEVNVCERCRRAEQLGNGERLPLRPAVAEMCECDAQHVDGTGKAPATQTIAPATRRQVVRRDGGRCVVPGCCHATFIDVHHLKPREEGGRHDAENLACLCGAHHRAVHEGKLIVTGTPLHGLVFRHADGSVYGAQSLDPVQAHRVTLVYGALRELGFRETECRRAIEQCERAIGSHANREELLREALRLLSERTAKVR